MKKVFLAVAVLAFVAGLVAFSTTASANKYRNMQRTTMQETASTEAASAESNRSMTDCMSFSASFKSQGMSGAKSMCNRQFGSPMAETGRVVTYSYDNYTNLVLDCSRGGCYTKCMSK